MYKSAILSIIFLIGHPFSGIRLEHEDEPVITLERTQCFGSCPAYILQIYSDGRIKYLGKEWVLVRGNAEGRMSVDSVNALLDETRKIGFFQFDDEYWSCGNSRVTDLPTITTTVTIDGKTKKVIDYYCAPESLPRFEFHIDRASRSLRWIGLIGDGNLPNYIDFDAKFPGADSLRRAWSHADSLLKIGQIGNYGEEYRIMHGGAVSEYEKRYSIAYKPFIDSMISARIAFYQSLTDYQVDSIYSTR